VITALIVLDAHPLAPGEAGPTLRFGKAENDLYDKYYLLGASIQRMPVGSSMSLHDTLETVLVASASNYAEAASTWAFGSPAGFRSAAARWLAANGLASTTIVEPTGIDPRNASTATDLLTIGRLAMANPVIAELVGTPSLTVPGLDPVSNTNSGLGVDGIDGIKTGTLDEAGACLLFSAVIDVGASTPLNVIGVVLGSSEQFVAGIGARELLASVRAGFHPVKLVSVGEDVGIYTAPWGANSSVEAATQARLLTWSDSPVTSTIEFDRTTSGRAGDEVGSITYTSETESVTVPLLLSRSIAAPGTWWRLSHPGVMLGWRWPD
jgi:D-alanyl-D-alanine carboxypeptidase (penicillin-binding protein 5/6)